MPNDVHRRRRAPLNPVLAALLAAGAVAVLFLAGVVAERYGNGEPAAATAVTSAPARSVPPSPGIRDKVRDGKFEFVVSGVDCSRNKIGIEHLERTAKGRYCVVSLSVRNIADDPKWFVGRAQKAFGPDGTGYGDDDLAGIYANRDTGTFLEKLGPGERVTGKLVFDVPKDVKVTSLELHDSLLSRGVTVDLR